MKKLVLFVCCLLLSHSGWAFWGKPSCDQADKVAKPAWVGLGYQYREQGFKVGFAQAHYEKEQNYQEQLTKAENLARSAIAKELQVMVESDLSVQTQEQTEGNKTAYQQKVVQRIRSRSKVQLPGLQIADKWQDPKTCHLYVLAKLPVDIAHLVSKKTIVQTLYQQAQDQQLPLNTRLMLLEDAIEIAQENEFSQLASSRSSQQMIDEYQVLRKSLLQQFDNKRHGVFFALNQPSAKTVSSVWQKLSGQVNGSFKGASCSSMAGCLAQARKTPALYASVVAPELELVKERGFYVGSYRLNLSVWDLKRNTRVYASRDDSLVRVAKIMSRQKHKINFDSGYEKWLLTNPEALDELAKHYP